MQRFTLQTGNLTFHLRFGPGLLDHENAVAREEAERKGTLEAFYDAADRLYEDERVNGPHNLSFDLVDGDFVVEVTVRADAASPPPLGLESFRRSILVRTAPWLEDDWDRYPIDGVSLGRHDLLITKVSARSFDLTFGPEGSLAQYGPLTPS